MADKNIAIPPSVHASIKRMADRAGMKLKVYVERILRAHIQTEAAK